MSGPYTQRGRIDLPAIFYLLIGLSVVLAVVAVLLAQMLGLVELVP